VSVQADIDAVGALVREALERQLAAARSLGGDPA
jgi:hypothetical protein